MVKIIDNTQECINILNSKIETLLSEVGEKAVNYAKHNTPVDTGNLKNSITFEIDSAEDKVSITTNVDYAIYVEEGVRNRPGKHMIRNSLSEHVNEYKEIISNNLKN